MPLANPESWRPSLGPELTREPEPPSIAHNWVDVLHSSIYLEFLGGNIADRWEEVNARWNGEEAGFNIWDPSIREKYPEMASMGADIVGVRNEEELAWRIASTMREREAKSIIEDAGWQGFWMSMGAAVGSPENLLPIGYFAKAGKGVFGAAKGGFKGGVYGAAAGEVGLQALQHEREALVSAASVAGSGAFGFVLGGAIGALRPMGRRVLSRQFKILMHDMGTDVANFTEAGKARIRAQDLVPKV